MLSIENLRSIFEFSPIPSLILYPNAPVYTIAYVNPAFFHVTQTGDFPVKGTDLLSFLKHANSRELADLPETKLYKEYFELPANKIQPINNEQQKTLYIIYYPLGITSCITKKEELKAFAVPNLNSGNVSFRAYGTNQRSYDAIFKEFSFTSSTQVKPKIYPPMMQDVLERLSFLVHESSDLIAVLDTAGNFLYSAPSSATILSLTPEHLIGKNIFDFVHHDDLKRVTKEFSMLPALGRIKIYPYRFAVSPGKFIWIETIAADLTHDPSIAGFVISSRDVSLEIEREIKAKDSIERFNILSKATSDAVYDWNFLNNEMIWNKGIQGIFGYKNIKDFKIDWWFNKVHQDDINSIWERLNLNIAAKKSRFTAEYRFKCADGSYKHVLDRSFLVYNENGSIIRIMGSLQDITDKVTYIKNIESQNSRLKEISWMQSHVVRAPLARLMALAELIKLEFGREQELLKHFEDSARELDKIVRSIIKKAEDAR